VHQERQNLKGAEMFIGQ